MIARETDGKGRVTLGKRFANRMVLVKEVNETEVMISIARVIPEREAWLYDNAAAKAAVFAGIEAARRGELTDGPDDLPPPDEEDVIVADIDGPEGEV